MERERQQTILKRRDDLLARDRAWMTAAFGENAGIARLGCDRIALADDVTDCLDPRGELTNMLLSFLAIGVEELGAGLPFENPLKFPDKVSDIPNALAHALADKGGLLMRGVASNADQLGAVPMFTLYQMATNGDGNLADLNDNTFMTRYWSNVRLLFQQIAAYGKPALVNLEPDFWGYAELQSNQNPTAMTALVTLNTDCASLTNDIVGIAGCMVKMARQYAPKAYIGFPPSDWGGGSIAQVVTFMQAVGAQHADFIQLRDCAKDARLPAWIAALKKAGIKINYFYTNDPAEAAKFFAAGVDFVLVDATEAVLSKQAGLAPLVPLWK